jgi:hypothetical protein
MIVQLIRLLFFGVRVATKYAQHNQDAPVEQLDNALFTRRSTSITQYIDIATKAMINDGKKVDVVKIILISRGLHEDHFDAVLNRAQRNYKTWLNETSGKSALTAFETDQQFAQTPPTPKSSIKIVTHKGEDHAMHFCALTDHRRYYELIGRSILQAIVDRAVSNTPIALSNGETEIRQATCARVGRNAVNPYLRVVTINQQIEAVYPYIYTEIKTSFYTKQIVEWVNGEPIVEAEVEGNLNGSIPVSFFATDYAVNKHIYQTQANIEVRLSALVLELFKADKNIDEISRKPREFWANKRYSNKSYFLFEAEILEIKEAPIDRLSTGSIMTLKLDQSKSANNDFIVDTYITNNNIKTESIHKGMLVRGTLWFQGEIAAN